MENWYFTLCSSRKLPLFSLALIIVYSQKLFYKFYALTVMRFLSLHVKSYLLIAEKFIMNLVTFKYLEYQLPLTW